MTHASLFSGIGGPEVAAAMLGWRNVFHCDINPFGRAVLDYWFPDSESYGDIKKTDFSKWGGQVDVLTGGFPCQPFSYAGQRRGSDDDRYLWPQFKRVIEEIRPAWVIGENVAGITTMVEQGEIAPMASQATLFDEGDGVRGYRCEQPFTIERVCSDLEGLGYEVQPLLIPACAVGAPHRRDRVFIVGCRIVANAHGGHDGGGTGENEGESGAERLQERHEVRQPGESGQVRREGEGYAFADTERLRLQYSMERGGEGRMFEKKDGRGQDGISEQIQQSSADGERGDATDTDNQIDGIDINAERIGWIKRQHDDGFAYGTQQTQCGKVKSGRADSPQDRWRNFPTISPVHRGDDGLPFSLDDLAISPNQWRTESLKAYGNAIVPQVMYEIFRAIEKITKQ